MVTLAGRSFDPARDRGPYVRPQPGYSAIGPLEWPPHLHLLNQFPEREER